MAPNIELHLTPAARLARTYTPVTMHGRAYLPLTVFGKETVAEVETQIRDIFHRCKASQEGSMTTAVIMADINHPVKKSLSTILEAARADDSRLLKPIQSSRFLPIYVDFRPLTVAKGENSPHEITSPALEKSIH